MTKEEALYWLDTIPTIGEQVDALEMAIKALEQEPVLDKIRAEIQGIEINGQIDERTLFIRSGNEVKNIALDIINKYTAYTAESEE